jgi:hypothetical protein
MLRIHGRMPGHRLLRRGTRVRRSVLSIWSALRWRSLLP